MPDNVTIPALQQMKRDGKKIGRDRERWRHRSAKHRQ
jgi:hypothetical protein